ncbi:MAG: hypothetical protein HQK92_15865 [Nitrospirae bacterium]|nr:hypothetical protein [Nitrospirota bacterium]
MESINYKKIFAVPMWLTILIIAGSLFFYYPLKRDMLELSKLSSTIKKRHEEVNQINIEYLKKTSNPLSGKRPYIKSIEGFLRKLNDVGKNSNVLINQVEPESGKDLQFNLKISADYFSFLRFISRLEALSMDISNLGIHQYDSTGAMPRHAISFTVTPLSGGQELPEAQALALKQSADNTKFRNPFLRSVEAEKLLKYKQVIDLTWIHKLTSIGFSGGKKEATIDDRVVTVGDNFPSESKRKVDSIGVDRVYLSEITDVGKIDYIIKFRKVKKID